MVSERQDIEEKYKWSISDVYQKEEEFHQDLEKVEEKTDQLLKYSEGFESAEELKEFLREFEEAKRTLQKANKYASMFEDQDMRNEQAQKLSQQAQSVSSSFSESTDFVKIQIQEIDSEELEQWIQQNRFLKERSRYLREIQRMEDHTLSLEMEQNLSLLSEVLDGSAESYQTLWNADLEFPTFEHDGEEIHLTPNQLTKVLRRPNEQIRSIAHEKFYDFVDEYSNTIALNLSKSLKKNWKLAQIRNYETTRQSALKPDQVPEKIYDNLVEAARNNVGVLNDHVRLKKETWGVENLESKDVYLPATERNEPEIEFSEAKEILLEALQPLGADYLNIIEKAFDQRWIDVYENKGKRSGAYSGGAYDTKPFILMNYQDDVNTLYTLAHELGHSVHSYLSTNNNPYLTHRYPIFLAEIASTVNETLLTQHLMSSKDPDLKAHALNQSLENFRSTFFRQTMFADFEHRIYQEVEEGRPLTFQRFNEVYRETKGSYYNVFEMDERIQREWARIPHFYYRYYVFQYATGISAAQQYADMILDGSVEPYIKFLKAGGSKPPIELLKETGVNMESTDPIHSLIDRYKERLKEMEGF